MALIAGGGTSNLLDRIMDGGRVTDFLNVGIGSLRTGIFNFADMAILAGAILVIVSYIAPPTQSSSRVERGILMPPGTVLLRCSDLLVQALFLLD